MNERLIINNNDLYMLHVFLENTPRDGLGIRPTSFLKGLSISRSINVYTLLQATFNPPFTTNNDCEIWQLITTFQPFPVYVGYPIIIEK